MPESATIQASGFVLAGGQSSRMGTEKALVHFDGEPLIKHALKTLRSVCASVAIAGGTPALAEYAPLVTDEVAFQGPLGGIVAALRQSTSDWNLFVPVDTPFLPVEALRTLLAATPPFDAVAILSQPADHTNPLIALYHRRALPTLARELASGRLRVRVAIEAAGPVVYTPFPEARQQLWFRNMNTMGDLAEAASLSAGKRR